MIAHFGNPWLWGPLLSGLGLAILVAIYAYFYNKPRCPFNVRDYFFNGPVRNWSGAGGTALTLLPILLSADVRADATSVCLLGAAAVLFAVSTLLGFRLYASVHSLKKPDEHSVRLESPRLIVEQGIVYSLIVTAFLTIVLFLLYSPVLGTSAEQPTPAPPPPSLEQPNG